MEEDSGCSGPPGFDDSHLRLPPLISLLGLPQRLVPSGRVPLDGRARHRSYQIGDIELQVRGAFDSMQQGVS
jgi:hypothetical protein